MREFEKEWTKQVQTTQPHQGAKKFQNLMDAFRKDWAMKRRETKREADQKRWWWEK